MKVIEFSASKGGVGVTNVACSVAMSLATNGNNVLLLDLGLERDTAAWFGLQSFERNKDHTQEAYNISIHSPWYDAPNIASVPIPEGEWDVVIVDAGRLQPRYMKNIQPERVVVLANDYMAIKNTLRERGVIDKYVVVMEQGRVLNERDLSNILGTTPVFVPRTEDVARRMDAGTISAHIQEYEWVREFLPRVTV